MKQATFSEGVVFALTSSVLVSVIFFILSGIFVGEGLFRILVAAAAFIYILYLFLRGKERFGRLTILSTWLIITISTFIFIPSLVLYILVQILMIWLIRALYFYNSVLTALADLALTVLSLVVSIWSWSVSQSLFLSFWSFFLVQALFVYIPKKISGRTKTQPEKNYSKDKFEYAYKSAELAVRKLTAHH